VLSSGYTVIARGAKVILGDCHLRLPDTPGNYALTAEVTNEGYTRQLPAVMIQVESIPATQPVEIKPAAD
jgi:hypothetical protein